MNLHCAKQAIGVNEKLEYAMNLLCAKRVLELMRIRGAR